MKVESGFTRKFFVVRRALDACLLENGRNGRRERIVRNEGLASGRKGTIGFMLLLRIYRRDDLGKKLYRSFDGKARDRYPWRPALVR